MKKRNNRSKTFLAQSIFLVLTVLIYVFSTNVFVTALNLHCISSEINHIEQYSSWTETDHERYDELMAERIAIKNESAIGYSLVMLGSNVLLQIFRIIILLGVFVLDIITFSICYTFTLRNIEYFRSHSCRKKIY